MAPTPTPHQRHRPTGIHHSASPLSRTIFQSPGLNETDERRLLSEYQTSEPVECRQKCLERLCLSCGKLVVSMARKYRRTPQELDDLISVGFIGLHGAIVDFDLKRTGVRLGTYATFRIKHEMQNYVRRTSHPVRLPDTNSHRQLMRHSRRLFEDAERACEREGLVPHHTELCRRVATRVGLSEYEVERTFELLANHHVALDDGLGLDYNATGLRADSHEEAMIFSLDRGVLRRRIWVLMGEILGRSERRVFQGRCMCDGDPERLDTLAAELGVSPQRIFQLEASAKRKVAVALAAQGLFGGDPMALIALTRVRAPQRTGQGTEIDPKPKIDPRKVA
jgi:RNA polymerase sigma factor (sigma-70 family)